MSPRTGRPKSTNPKSYEIKTRLDERTGKALEEYAEKHGISRGEVMRRAVRLVLGLE